MTISPDIIIPPDVCRKQIAEAKKKLRAVEQARVALEKNAEDLRSLIRANANFLPPDERLAELLLIDIVRTPTNITQAVQTALILAATADMKLTPVEVRDFAENNGFDFSEYANPMASIHAILKRLKETAPPQVSYDEATGTYLMINPPDNLMAPEFEAKVTRNVWEMLKGDKSLKELAISAMRDIAVRTVGHTTEELEELKAKKK